MGSQSRGVGAPSPTDDSAALGISISSSSIISGSININISSSSIPGGDTNVSYSSSNISEGTGSDPENSTANNNNSSIKEGPKDPGDEDDGIRTVWARPTPQEEPEEVFDSRGEESVDRERSESRD